MESGATKAQVKSETKGSVKVLEELLSKLSVSKTADEAVGTTQEIAMFINGGIEDHDAPTKYVEQITPYSISRAWD